MSIKLSERWMVFLALLLAGLLSACVSPAQKDEGRTPAARGQVTKDEVATPPAILTAAPPTATPTPMEPVATETPRPAPTAAATTGPAPRLDALRLRLEPAVQGLAAPVFISHAGDNSGRLFVVEKAGVIRVLSNKRLLSDPFLDIRDRVGSDGSEQGLLGLAFPPDFSRTGHFFVNYTDGRGDTVVARFSAFDTAGAADPGSEFRILALDQPAANHNGGMLAFGPDGHLWIGTGDGGSANDRFGNGQNSGTLLGKLLRLDVTSDPGAPYQIPADNPWASAERDAADVRDEIWAVGLRNPWRFSFDRATGDLWIADVGQNLYEEVNFTPAGARGGLNFGWPIMEGVHCFPKDANCARTGLEIPVLDYEHGANGCSITGGYVYRGAQFPALQGVYLYGDYCSGKIWGLAPDGGGWRSLLLVESGLNISSFGEDETGEVYVVDLRGGVYRIVVE